MLDAIASLRAGFGSLVGVEGTRTLPRSSRVLERIIEATTGEAMASAWAAWRRAVALSEATLDVEDELFVTQRELRRAQAVLERLHGASNR